MHNYNGMTNPISYFIFSKTVFICYLCPFLSTKLFLHNYNGMTGSDIYDRQINNNNYIADHLLLFAKTPEL